ncbi:transglutaminase-like cysteine peptidase [Stutzerimonas stutzeri]|uniref:cysteine protease LapG n=1 Tax=Stutzerimonas sp. S1 TaxID=3030652 RepID=UPI00222546D5|nr:transglutaminase-like cysteine peptidase [Stutzerimonas sp. S1]MCW3150759.1 transglutaminase-like cysteine peptidase [Stutzerimonas sp. S1]
MQPLQPGPASRHRPLVMFLVLVLLSTPIWSLARSASWQPWDFERIYRSLEKRYGALDDALPRIEAWQALLQQSGELPELQQLAEVNRFFNRHIRFSDDVWVWEQDDYWATPVESLIRGAGDCEDYALAKYFTLRRLGVPSDRLRITYVKALRLNQAHMVLTYYATPTADPLVLDNIDGAIRPASQRQDLLPVYAFNAEGLYVPGAGGGKRSGDSKRLSRWQDVLLRMRAEGFVVGEG